MKKTLPLRNLWSCVLAVLAVSASMLSCGSSEVKDGSDSLTAAAHTSAEQSSDTEAPDSLSARKNVSDDVPPLDFDGKEFRIFYQKRYTTDAVPEEGKEGDVLNDAVYRRNQTIEERFNVHIAGIEGEEQKMVDTLSQAVSAGDDICDLYLGHSLYSGPAATKGCFCNWYDIPYLDFSKPWFPQAAIDDLTINHRMYLSMADICLSFISNTYGMFFNQQLAQNNDLPDLYAMVRDGTWTIDALSTLSKDLYVDLNGSGSADTYDQYGFGGETTNHLPTWIFACDVPTVEFHEDRSVRAVFHSERTALMLDKLKKLYFENPGSLSSVKRLKENEMTAAFMNNQIVFLTNSVGEAEWSFRDLDFDYGIIPYPKLNEEQEHYYTIPGGSVSCLAAPVTIPDPELLGAVTAALCRESWVSVMPTYYDIVLKVKGARDEESIEMLDMIMDGRMVSTSFLYDAWQGYNYTMSDLLRSKKTLASFCAGKDKQVVHHYEKVLKLFYEDPV